jgi:acid phosphatase type 7
MSDLLKRMTRAIGRTPVGVRIAVLAAAVGLAFIAAVVHDQSDSGAKGDVDGAHSSAYLGPRGGNGWVRSRPTRRSVVWAIGDGADGGADGRAVASMVGARRVDRLLYLGDVYESGTAGEFQANYKPLYARFDDITAPTIGNHEWPNVATGYVPYWSAARGSPPPFWYAFAASGWQLISLNSNSPASTSPAQLGWLRGEIRKTPRYGDCRIAFMHHPIFSAGLHGDLASLQPIFDELRGHASIVLSGHDHDIQRLHPIDGITPLVDGAGGQELYPVNREDPRLAFADDTEHGALRIRLSPGRANLAFVGEDGTTLDRSAVGCRQG